MPEWLAILALPSVDLHGSIECDVAALVSSRDDRMQPLYDENPHLRTFLGRFTDTFHEELSPAVLLIKTGAPNDYRKVEAIAGFRDLIALSVVPYERAQRLKYPAQHRNILHGNYFTFHPWMINRDDEYITTQTMAMLALHEVSHFFGQSTPEVSTAYIRAERIDVTLYQGLSKRWIDHYGSQSKTWKDTALFRSLNMAYQAIQAPLSVDVTIYDIGRSTALWVSAFEILTHPGGVERGGPGEVIELLESVDWREARMSDAIYETTIGKDTTKRILASHIYSKIYRVRNRFLHGNPVDNADLTFLNVKPSTITFYASILYRLALAAFLDEKFRKEPPSGNDIPAFVKWHSERGDFYDYQEMAERALLVAVP